MGKERKDGGEKSAATVCVSGLPHSFTNAQLEEAFSDVGPVRLCFMITSKGSNEHRCFGFVKFALPEDANRAIELKNGSTVGGCNITVKQATHGPCLIECRTKAAEDRCLTPPEKEIEEPIERKSPTKLHVDLADMAEVVHSRVKEIDTVRYPLPVEEFQQNESESNLEWDNNLPTRLFATDRFPSGRLNIYSKPDTLTFIHDVMKDTPEFETILNSSFGKLFDFPAARCPISCKLVHALLTRQLISKKKYELWTVFGGQPLRFSLMEFGDITGLPCGEFPEDYDTEYQAPNDDVPDEYWKELIGEDPKTSLADIAGMLKGEPNMPGSRRIRLALILIVDAVLIANIQVPKPTPKYVRMLKDLDSFFSFPWGRESFLRTIASMRPGRKIQGKCQDPVGTYRQHLRQSTFVLKGFPLVLQLLAFRAIPSFLAKLPDPSDQRTLLDYCGVGFPHNASLTLNDVLYVENNTNLVVQPHIPLEVPTEEGWGEWDDEIRDKKVAHLEELIKKSYVFKKCVWPGGDSSTPLIVHIPTKPEVLHKKHIVDRRKGKGISNKRPELRVKETPASSKKASSRRKQQRENGVISAAPEDIEEQNIWLISQVQDLSLQLNKLADRTSRLEQQLKRRKTVHRA